MNVIENQYLSKRAEVVKEWEDFLNKFMNLCNKDEFHATKNPNGYTNLGTAVNNLSLDIILPRLTRSDIWMCNPSFLQYREGYGTIELRKALATIMTKFLKSHEEVDPDNLFCTTGVTSCIDLLAHCIADPGDVILAPTPIYSRIYTDMKQRSRVDLWPIPIIEKGNTEEFPQLTVEKIQAAFLKARSENRVVRGIFIINPSNPLGDIYPPHLMMNILKFCSTNNLHIIIDEVYALSIFPSEDFHSVLQFDQLPDENRTHVLYGISKDFGIAGLRIGTIHTKCKELQNCLKQLTFFPNIPYPVMDIAARYLEDLEWLKEYIDVYQKRLWDNYMLCYKRLHNMGLPVRKSKAGFFLWVNFGEVFDLKSFAQEKKLFDYLFDEHHVYIVPGSELFCSQPGWFRLTFTAFPEHVDEGLDRIEKALQMYKSV